MQDIMIDLETMGVTADAAIVAIGAQAFDLTTGQLGDAFYRCVDLGSAVANGGTIDPSSMMWWLSQGDEARGALLANRRPLGQVLLDFGDFCRQQGPAEALRVWGNGADFDCVILASAYRRFHLTRPWGPFGNRCYRTIKSLHRDIKLERTGTHHNALDDAISQARHLVAMIGPAVVQTPAGEPVVPQAQHGMVVA